LDEKDPPVMPNQPNWNPFVHLLRLAAVVVGAWLLSFKLRL